MEKIKNHEIPDLIWDLKNEILTRMEALTSNNEYYLYKSLWKDFSDVAQYNGRKIEELINRYTQPKFD